MLYFLYCNADDDAHNIISVCLQCDSSNQNSETVILYLAFNIVGFVKFVKKNTYVNTIELH